MELPQTWRARLRRSAWNIISNTFGFSNDGFKKELESVRGFNHESFENGIQFGYKMGYIFEMIP